MTVHDISAGPQPASLEPAASLRWCLERIGKSQGVVLDGLRLHESLDGLAEGHALPELALVMHRMGCPPPIRLAHPDRARLPLLAPVADVGWAVVVDQEPDGRWTVETAQQRMQVPQEGLEHQCLELNFKPAHAQASAEASAAPDAPKGFAAVLQACIRRFRGAMAEAAIASLFIGALALATSLFSMQIYDRVIPTKGVSTLVVLSIGVGLGILIELAMKFVRARLMDRVAVSMDGELSREVFQRLLALRVDQLPASVGSLVGQLKGYEQVRSFYTANTLFTLVDVPVGLLFLVVMALIASPKLALVPLVMAGVSLAIGLLLRRRAKLLAEQGAGLTHAKTGLLVEAVEGVETIKSGSGGWRFLSRWLRLNAMTIRNDLAMKHASESAMHFAGTVQQLSYAGVIIVGALLVMSGEMTTGALIACSILSGRVLSPIMALPGLIVQHAHARAALDALGKLYQLKTDHADVERVLIPEKLDGHFRLEGVKFAYGDHPPALVVNRLEIKAGERVGIIGPIGSGKSTLLRLLSGLYVPTEGKVLIDGLDMSHVSRELINRRLGYLQQEHRLFQGTLRENLLIGMADPGDDALLDAMRRTGMDRFVQSHPKGLDRPIMEGGKGLSGGQRQLLAFTRLVLADPSIVLLDEPTANMDEEQERRCLQLLSEKAKTGATFVVVTHKPSVLPMVDRLIVVKGNRIALDGPRDAVMAQLTYPPVRNLPRDAAPRVAVA